MAVPLVVSYTAYNSVVDVVRENKLWCEYEWKSESSTNPVPTITLLYAESPSVSSNGRACNVPECTVF